MKKDNKGFSLIEVMVGIMILAIIVAPFLASFLRATKINAKSRKMLRATTVAENVMEGLSGFTIEDISKQFNDIYNLQQKIAADGSPEEDAAGNLIKESQFLIFNNSTDDVDKVLHAENKIEIKDADGNVVGEEMSVKDGVFSQNPGNIYEFVLQNVTEDKHKFDVKITIDASKYRVVDNKNIKDGQDYNVAAGKMFNVAEMNPTTDVIWAEPEGMETRYRDDYIAGIQETETSRNFSEETKKQHIDAVKAMTNEEFLRNCSRSFDLMIDDDNVGISMMLLYDGIDIPVDMRSVEKYFPMIQRKEELKNIYLCYYPKYNMIKDYVQIHDETGLDGIYEALDDNRPETIDYSILDYHYNIYIIKQQKDASANINETDYKVDVNIMTPKMSLKAMLDGFGFLDNPVYQNVLDNMSDFDYPYTLCGNLGHYFEKDGQVSEVTKLISNQLNFYSKYTVGNLTSVNGDVMIGDGSAIDPEILEKMGVVVQPNGNMLRYSDVDRSTKNLIYYTKVEVYEADPDRKIGDNKYNFEDDEPIAKLDSEQVEIP